MQNVRESARSEWVCTGTNTPSDLCRTKPCHGCACCNRTRFHELRAVQSSLYFEVDSQFGRWDKWGSPLPTAVFHVASCVFEQILLPRYLRFSNRNERPISHVAAKEYPSRSFAVGALSHGKALCYGAPAVLDISKMGWRGRPHWGAWKWAPTVAVLVKSVVLRAHASGLMCRVFAYPSSWKYVNDPTRSRRDHPQYEATLSRS